MSKGNAPVALRMRALDRSQRHAVLATDAEGQPYTSLIAYAVTPDLTGVIFCTPRSTSTYRNLKENNRVAILVDTRKNGDSGYLGSDSLTMLGTARPMGRGKMREYCEKIFLRKHPRLAEFVRSSSTALVLVTRERCLHVSSFQTVSEWHP